jgi:ubiquinone/menaquinone biosynthesis C-methylase UbiE
MVEPNQLSALSLRMYTDLAPWWPLLSAPEDYAEEAAFFQEIMLEYSSTPPQTVLELGSGGGNNASFLKHFFRLTLVDLSNDMLAVSRKLNPECEHIQGDMRTLTLDRVFDAVFVHDAVMYMTNLRDLRKAISTAYEHCREEGVVLCVPDFVRETFNGSTQHGGHDQGGRAARYLSWTYDPDPDDSTYMMNFSYLLRDEQDRVQNVFDQHELGLFSQKDWLNVLSNTGFDPMVVKDPFDRLVFLGVKNAL